MMKSDIESILLANKHKQLCYVILENFVLNCNYTEYFIEYLSLKDEFSYNIVSRYTENSYNLEFVLHYDNEYTLKILNSKVNDLIRMSKMKKIILIH